MGHVLGLLKRLRGRLVLSTVLLHVLFAPFVFWAVFYGSQMDMESTFAATAHADANRLGAFLEHLGGADDRRIQRLLEDVARTGSILFARFEDAAGNVIAEVSPHSGATEVRQDREVGGNRDTVFYVKRPVASAASVSSGILTVGYDVRGLIEQSANLRLRGAMLLAAYLGLGVLLAVMFAVEIARPIRILRQRAQSFASGEFGAAFSVDATIPDIGELAVDMETMRRELVLQAKRLEYQVLHDPLTGLPNRLLLEQRVTMATQRTTSNRREFSLLLLDLNSFKAVNDSLGHMCGDMLLQHVAKKLRGALRDTDTVARFGGDEFAVMLDGTRTDRARLVAEKIHALLRGSVRLDGSVVDLSCAIGIAGYPDDGPDYGTLLRRADMAMYVAKADAVPYAVYCSDRDPHRPEAIALVSELKQAIDDGALELLYQPIVDLRTKRLTAVEALARWNHPTLGLLEPSQFIGLAETTGLIDALTDLVVSKALRRSRDMAVDGNHIPVSVNISPRNVASEQFERLLEAVLTREAHSAGQLVLELTEPAILGDPKRVEGLLSRLRARGIRVAIDDYGTGYSSLAHMQGLAIAQIKIDHQLVRNLRENTANHAVVKAMIEMAHTVGMSVIAEGVESRAVYELLRGMGCDQGQGHYLYMPMTGAELDAVVSRRCREAS